MHHDRVDLGLLEQGDVAGEGLAELEIAHGVAAIFDHDRLALIALHVGQGLGEDAGIVAEPVGVGGLIGHGGGQLPGVAFIRVKGLFHFAVL